MKRRFVMIVFAILSITLLFNCSEMEKVTNSADLNESGSSGFMTAAYYPADLPEAVHTQSVYQLARTGCTFYSFTDGDWNIYPSYEDLVFVHYPDQEIYQTWLQYEPASVLSWYPALMELPETAASINLDILDNEQYEEWFPGSGFYRAIGAWIYLYDEDHALIGEFETTANSDWQNMTLASDDGSVIKYIGFIGKYSEDETNLYAPSYMRFKNVTICYAPPCSAPELSLEASQASIWPPNQSTVSVNFSGLVTNDCGGAEYVLVDEYDELSYSGTLESGEYSIDLDLIASRRGNDRDGRVYTFTITTGNYVGTVTQSADVVVLHDKGKKK